MGQTTFSSSGISTTLGVGIATHPLGKRRQLGPASNGRLELNNRGGGDSYFLGISNPASLVLRETSEPSESRVVWNSSLVRPRIWPWLSRTTSVPWLNPLVTLPMT